MCVRVCDLSALCVCVCRWAPWWLWAGCAPGRQWIGASSGTSSWPGSSLCPSQASSAPPSWPSSFTASCEQSGEGGAPPTSTTHRHIHTLAMRRQRRSGQAGGREGWNARVNKSGSQNLWLTNNSFWKEACERTAMWSSWFSAAIFSHPRICGLSQLEQSTSTRSVCFVFFLTSYLITL